MNNIRPAVRKSPSGAINPRQNTSNNPYSVKDSYELSNKKSQVKFFKPSQSNSILPKTAQKETTVALKPTYNTDQSPRTCLFTPAVRKDPILKNRPLYQDPKKTDKYHDYFDLNSHPIKNTKAIGSLSNKSGGSENSANSITNYSIQSEGNKLAIFPKSKEIGKAENPKNNQFIINLSNREDKPVIIPGKSSSTKNIKQQVKEDPESEPDICTPQFNEKEADNGKGKDSSYRLWSTNKFLCEGLKVKGKESSGQPDDKNKKVPRMSNKKHDDYEMSKPTPVSKNTVSITTLQKNLIDLQHLVADRRGSAKYNANKNLRISHNNDVNLKNKETNVKNKQTKIDPNLNNHNLNNHNHPNLNKNSVNNSNSKTPEIFKNKQKDGSKNIKTQKQKIQRILPTGSQICLQAITAQKAFNVKVLIIRLLDDNETSSTYLVKESETNFLYCLKKCEIVSTQGIEGIQGLQGKEKGASAIINSLPALIKQAKAGLMANHPNIIKTNAVLFDECVPKKHIYYLMEFVQGGTLYSKNKKQLKKKPSKQQVTSQSMGSTECSSYSLAQQISKLSTIREIITQILSGLEWFHEMRIIHRDIKPSNILISHDVIYKIGDLGNCAYDVERRGCEKNHERIGSLDYIAPQIVIGSEGFDTAVDIWAVGCIAYELYTGYPPFYDECCEKTISKIGHCEYNINLISDEGLKSFIESILTSKSKSRPSATAILQHQFLAMERSVFSEDYR